jgi:hypothetical protein
LLLISADFAEALVFANVRKGRGDADHYGEHSQFDQYMGNTFGSQQSQPVIAAVRAVSKIV